MFKFITGSGGGGLTSRRPSMSNTSLTSIPLYCFLLVAFCGSYCGAQFVTPYVSLTTVAVGHSVNITGDPQCSAGSPSVSFSAATTPNTAGGTYIGTIFPNSPHGTGVATWTPTTAGTFYINGSVSGGTSCSNETATPHTTTLIVTGNLQGYINPKYLVVGVTYSPPGPNSNVTYTKTSALSNTSSTSQSFTNGTSLSVSLMHGVGIAKVLSGSITASYSTSFMQTSSNSNSITISQMSQRSTEVLGPTNAYAPVNHDYDIIWIWLNPVEIYSVPSSGSGTVIWNGYGFDAADQPDLDIYPLTVGLLNGHLGSNPYGNILSRSWATGQNYGSGNGPGLTQSDINNILAADPYTNPSAPYTFTLDPNSSPATTTDGRFTLASNGGGEVSDFIYQQAAPGGQPLTQGLSNGYSTVSALGMSLSKTSTQTYGIDTNFTGGAWLGKFSLDIKTQYSFAVTTGSSSSVATTTGIVDSLSITGPPCGGMGTSPCVPTYTAPTEFDVFQDNMFGTFLFNPIR